MDSKLRDIYNLMFIKPMSKTDLAGALDVSTKTIENRVQLSNGNISYSKKMGCYYFDGLMPDYISYANLMSMGLDGIVNKVFYDELITIHNQVNMPLSEIMLPTDSLSPLLKMVIKLQIAINHSCVLSIEYTGYRGTEKKIIRPGKVFISSGTFYLAAVYDVKNRVNIGEKRTFALNSIVTIMQHSYVDNCDFRIFDDFNAFGSFEQKDQHINLLLKGNAAIHFLREGLKGYKSEFIRQNIDNSIELKLFYRDSKDCLEVVRLIQSWMPYIVFADKSENAQKIMSEITKNYESMKA